MNNGDCTLADLKAGERATVAALHTEEGMRHRLWDMGMVEGTAVECVFQSPSGDPAAYVVRGTVMALRRTDAATITVKREEVGG